MRASRFVPARLRADTPCALIAEARGVTLVVPEEHQERIITAPTTLKLTDELKERIAPLAQAAGKTPHAWMIDALERQAALAEARADFMRAAERSAHEVDAGGALYAAADVVDYLVARTVNRNAQRPRPVAKRVKGSAPLTDDPTRRSAASSQPAARKRRPA